jgi:hypothetical protein
MISLFINAACSRAARDRVYTIEDINEAPKHVAASISVASGGPGIRKLQQRVKLVLEPNNKWETVRRVLLDITTESKKREY